jgi:hypothetical protein
VTYYWTGVRPWETGSKERGNAIDTPSLEVALVWLREHHPTVFAADDWQVVINADGDTAEPDANVAR